MHVEAKSLIRETLWMSFYNSFVSYALYSYLYMILLLLFDVAFVILPLCVGLISLVSSLTLRVFGKHVVYNSSPTNNYIRLVVAAWIVSLIVSLTLTQWPDTYWPHAVAQFIVSAQASLCAVCPHAIFSAMTTDQANIGNKYIGSFLIAGYVGRWFVTQPIGVALTHRPHRPVRRCHGNMVFVRGGRHRAICVDCLAGHADHNQVCALPRATKTGLCIKYVDGQRKCSGRGAIR